MSWMLLFASMPKRDIPSRVGQRRPRLGLGKKTLVYFTDAERKTIDRAAELERRSISNFIASAAIAAAKTVLRKDSLDKETS